MHALFGLYGLSDAYMTADISAAHVASLIFCLQYRRTKYELAQTARSLFLPKRWNLTGK